MPMAIIWQPCPERRRVPNVARVFLIVAALTLMSLTACSEPQQKETPTPRATTEATTTQATTPAEDEPAASPQTPKPAAPISTPPPTTTNVPGSTLTSETAPTESPSPTPNPVSTATLAPTPTGLLTVTSAPTPTNTPIPTPFFGHNPDPTPTPSPRVQSLPATNLPTPEALADTWRGIVVAAENRCSHYDSGDYPYSPSVESEIVANLGGIYGPYTGTWFESIKETDIEHIMARSEAHDSGLCSATPETRRQFASDLLNLTLASPSVNRHQKSDHDPAEWLPALNQCWYVNRVIQVRLQYDLTIDPSEAKAIDQVLASCPSTEMVIVDPGESAGPNPTPTPTGEVDALALYDDNGNGRITCSEARAHGIAPVLRGHPAYQYMRDADGDGVVCK